MLITVKVLKTGNLRTGTLLIRDGADFNIITGIEKNV